MGRKSYPWSNKHFTCLCGCVCARQGCGRRAADSLSVVHFEGTTSCILLPAGSHSDLLQTIRSYRQKLRLGVGYYLVNLLRCFLWRYKLRHTNIPQRICSLITHDWRTNLIRYFSLPLPYHQSFGQLCYSRSLGHCSCSGHGSMHD